MARIGAVFSKNSGSCYALSIFKVFYKPSALAGGQSHTCSAALYYGFNIARVACDHAAPSLNKRILRRFEKNALLTLVLNVKGRVK